MVGTGCLDGYRHNSVFYLVVVDGFLPYTYTSADLAIFTKNSGESLKLGDFGAFIIPWNPWHENLAKSVPDTYTCYFHSQSFN